MRGWETASQEGGLLAHLVTRAGHDALGAHAWQDLNGKLHPVTADPADLDLRGALANAVKERRLELGLSQRELAERAAVADGTISKVELAKLSPTVETLAKIAGGLDLELADLIEQMAPRKGRMRPTYTVSSGPWASMRREVLLQVIADMGSREAAAEALGVSRAQLRRWLSE